MAKKDLDINKLVDQGAQNMRLSDLANRGINKVKVLDETALHDLIEQAVDKVVHSQSSEERARIAEQSRAQLQRFIKERNEFMSQRDMLEIGKKDLVTQIEALQNEVKAHRDLQEQSEASFQSQLKPIVQRQQEAEAQSQALREENDKIAEALEKTEAELNTLKASQNDVREAAEVEQHNLKVELENAEARANTLEMERDEAIKKAEAAEARIQEVQDEAKAAEMRAKAAEGKAQALEGKAREVEERSSEEQKSLDDALEEVDRLTTKIEEKEEAAKKLAEMKDKKIAELEAEIQRLKDELDRLKADLGRKEQVAAEAQKAKDDLKKLQETSQGQIRAVEKRLNDAEMELAKARDQAGKASKNEKAEEEAKKAREDLRKLQETSQGQIKELEKRANDAEMELARVRDKAAKTAPPPPKKKAEPPKPPAEPRKEEAQKEEAPKVEAVPMKSAVPTVAPRVSGASARQLVGDGGGAVGKGLDIGTVNLVAAENNEKGEVLLRKKRNAFLDVAQDTHTRSMLKRLKVPYVVQGRRLYVLGEAAFELANVLNKNTRRPMKDGLISPKEQDALPIMRLLISSILGEPRVKKEVCFYSVPGDPVDSDLSVVYHRDLFDAALKSLGYKPSHIIEGHAVTFAELAEEDFTGIGISCGGGMFNICVAYKSMPALFFSTSKSGDWVDQSVAQAMGIKPAKAALIKEEGIDLMNPKDRFQDAIAIYYRKLIKDNLTQIKDHFSAAETMPSFPDPISIVFSGGTAMAGNFIALARDVFKDLEFPIEVKELRLARDPLNSTAKGCLTAAMLEMAQQAAS